LESGRHFCRSLDDVEKAKIEKFSPFIHPNKNLAPLYEILIPGIQLCAPLTSTFVLFGGPPRGFVSRIAHFQVSTAICRGGSGVPGFRVVDRAERLAAYMKTSP